MSGFQSPNHTQSPNDFFEMLPDMSDAEIRVTLVMIRNTFGWHRESFKMGLNKLADSAGLSRNGAKDGAEAAEKRGTFRRLNPDAQGEAEWELIIEGSHSVTTSPNDQVSSHPVTTPPSVSDPQVGVKESIKESVNKEEEGAVFKLFEREIGLLTPIISDMLQDDIREHSAHWVREAIRIASARGARNLKFIEAILKRWKVDGYGSGKKNVPSAAEPASYGALRKFAEEIHRHGD